MRVTVLGASGAWPPAGGACSGYLVETDGFRLLLDIGYATMPRLLTYVDAVEIDAVYVTHGHPDHCADLNPLLRARALRDEPAPPLPVYAPPAALDAVLALDRPGMLDAAYRLHDLAPGAQLRIGPFEATTALLPHWLPDAGVRLTARDGVLAYTGDTGPSPAVVELARDADLLIGDCCYADEVPSDASAYQTDAWQAGAQAAAAGVRRLLLAHLMPGEDAAAALAAARTTYGGPVDVAVPDLVLEVG